MVLAQQRADGPAEGPVDNYVHDNIVVQADVPDDPYNGFFLGWMDDYPSALFAPGSNNRGQDDRYWAPTADGAYVRFGWGEQPWWKLSDFSATPGDVGGRYLSAAEKDQVLARAGVPAEPSADGVDARN